jgi:N-glycosylase/DNA lyase
MVRRADRTLAADEELLPGVRWGSPGEPLTPAYWAALGRKATSDDSFHNPEGTLAEEIVFCLLGGFGIRAEINVAAFRRLCEHGVLDAGGAPTNNQIEALLSEPLIVDGRRIRYRFPHQRAERIAAALVMLQTGLPPTEPLILRRWLLRIAGIGPKTASWIVRNHLDCDEVAILDIHVIRACQVMNVFSSHVKMPRDYEVLERKFLAFSAAIGVRASVLDAIIWRQMRAITR